MSSPTRKAAGRRKQLIHYRAVKVVGRPIKVEFTTKDGREVSFKGVKTEIDNMTKTKKKVSKVVKDKRTQIEVALLDIALYLEAGRQWFNKRHPEGIYQRTAENLFAPLPAKSKRK